MRDFRMTHQPADSLHYLSNSCLVISSKQRRAVRCDDLASDALFKIRIVALADHSAFQDDVSALITVAHSFHVIAHDIICSVHMGHEGHGKGTFLIGPEDAMDDRSVSISHIQSQLLKLPDKRFLQHTLPLSRRPAFSCKGRIAHCIKLCIADEASADAFGEINHERSVQQAFVF